MSTFFMRLKKIVLTWSRTVAMLLALRSGDWTWCCCSKAWVGRRWYYWLLVLCLLAYLLREVQSVLQSEENQLFLLRRFTAWIKNLKNCKRIL